MKIKELKEILALHDDEKEVFLCHQSEHGYGNVIEKLYRVDLITYDKLVDALVLFNDWKEFYEY